MSNQIHYLSTHIAQRYWLWSTILIFTLAIGLYFMRCIHNKNSQLAMYSITVPVPNLQVEKVKNAMLRVQGVLANMNIAHGKHLDKANLDDYPAANPLQFNKERLQLNQNIQSQWFAKKNSFVKLFKL